LNDTADAYSLVDDSSLKMPDVLTYRDIMTPEQVGTLDTSVKGMLDDINKAKATILTNVTSMVGGDNEFMSMRDLKDATTIITQIENTLEGGTEGLLDTLVAEYGFIIEDV